MGDSTNGSIQKNTKKEKEVKPMLTIIEALDTYTDSLMALPGVQGAGMGKKGEKDCVVVYVSKISKSTKQKIQKMLEGYPLTIEKTGQFHAMPKK
ncbi:MAG: hypothetical protein ABSG15_07230 [FCB group bacterium]